MGLGLGLLFGDGSDGNVTISSNTSLTEPKFYDNLTVNSGVSLNVNGFPVYVKGTLTLNGTIHCDGTSASGATPGIGGGNQTLGSIASRWSGGDGGPYTGPSGLTPGTPPDYGAVFSSAGGNGGDSDSHAKEGGSGTNSNTIYTERWIKGLGSLLSGLHDGPVLNQSSLDSRMSKRLRGGLGGGGGGYFSGNPGAGGGGGGVVRVFASALAGSGTLASRGGNGANGASSTGGGGGGGGGVVILVSAASSHSYTMTVTGGTAGTGSGGGFNGSAGSSGFSKFLVT